MNSFTKFMKDLYESAKCKLALIKSKISSMFARIFNWFYTPEIMEEITPENETEDLVEEMLYEGEEQQAMEIMDVKEASTIISDLYSATREVRVKASGSKEGFHQLYEDGDIDYVLKLSGKYNNVISNADDCLFETVNTTIICKGNGDSYNRCNIFIPYIPTYKGEIWCIYDDEWKHILEISDGNSNIIYWRKEGFDPNKGIGVIKL